MLTHADRDEPVAASWIDTQVEESNKSNEF
jgi:hypothetical protein